MTKIAITGAAGFIGSNLAKHLAARGHAIYGCDIAHREGIEGFCEFERVDILNTAALADWLKPSQAEIVYHLGARTDLLGRDLADYRANTTGVENIVSVCSAIPRIRRVVFASSRMVCLIDHLPKNYDDYCPPNPYGESKVNGEQIVKNAKTPFEWVMVRPTSIWGPGFGIPYRNFFDQIRKRRYFHPGKYRPVKSFGYIGNTVFQLTKLLDASTDSVNKKCFYLGDYEPLCLNDWADYIHQSFGLSGEIPTVPMPLLRMAGCVGTIINGVLNKELSPLTTFRLNNLITNMVYPHLDELRQITGDLPFDWKAGTRHTVEWLNKDFA